MSGEGLARLDFVQFSVSSPPVPTGVCTSGREGEGSRQETSRLRAGAPQAQSRVERTRSGIVYTLFDLSSSAAPYRP